MNIVKRAVLKEADLVKGAGDYLKGLKNKLPQVVNKSKVLAKQMTPRRLNKGLQTPPAPLRKNKLNPGFNPDEK